MDPFVVVGPGTLDGRSAGDVVPLPPDVDKHLRTVLRRSRGSGLVVSDGAGTTASAELVPDGARCLADPEHTPAPVPTVHVLQGIGKGRKVDEVVRTLTELGVDGVTPVAAARSVKELDGAKRDKAIARWRAVAVAAAEQSRRPHVPRVGEPGTVAEVLGRLAGTGRRHHILVAQVGAATSLSAAVGPELRDVDEVVLAVGPEGGWTDDEIATFESHDAAVVSLGAPVLRTEHAGTALGAVVMFTLGRMD